MRVSAQTKRTENQLLSVAPTVPSLQAAEGTLTIVQTPCNAVMASHVLQLRALQTAPLLAMHTAPLRLTRMLPALQPALPKQLAMKRMAMVNLPAAL